MGHVLRSATLVIAALPALAAAERINHAGRILDPTPVVSTPTAYNTPAADAVMSTLQLMPRDSAWNEDISTRPVHANSAGIMAQIRNDVSVKTFRVFHEMSYLLVPDSQPMTDLHVVDYPDDSDMNGGTSPVGRYPLATSVTLLEGWPMSWPGATIYQSQIDYLGAGGDRHTVTLMPASGRLFETWSTYLTTNAPAWECGGAAIFDVTSNTMRAAGLSSADAAGLPMLPALIRYDEIQRGEIEHALRLIVGRSRREYIYPARHYASALTGANFPAMGQRIRLKASYAIPDGWSAASKAVARAMKRYGAFVADNGSFFNVDATPDSRWPAGCFDDVTAIDISSFEVVQTTGESEGPRSAGAPTANAGADQSVAVGASAALSGSATGSGLTTTWYVYPYTTPPGTVTFANPAALATSASFSAAGTYTLMLKASDGVHTPAYDAVVVTVGGSPSGTAPTIGAVSATPSAVTGTSTALAVTATDDGGEAALSYTWSSTGPAAVAVNPNGSHAASAAVAVFSAAGAYDLTVTVADAGGSSASATVHVDVAQAAASIAVMPATASVRPGASLAFAVALGDQFGQAMPGAAPGGLAWSVSGGGAIDTAGVFAAGAAEGGPYTVSVTGGGYTGQAEVTVETPPKPRTDSLGDGGGGPMGCGGGSVGLLALAGILRLRRRTR